MVALLTHASVEVLCKSIRSYTGCPKNGPCVVFLKRLEILMPNFYRSTVTKWILLIVWSVYSDAFNSKIQWYSKCSEKVCDAHSRERKLVYIYLTWRRRLRSGQAFRDTLWSSDIASCTVFSVQFSMWPHYGSCSSVCSSHTTPNSQKRQGLEKPLKFLWSELCPEHE